MSYGYYQGFLDSSVGKESICNVGDSGDAGLIPASGRSPGAEDGNALQYPCLKIPMNRRAWWDIVQRVTKSQTWPSMHNDMVIIIFLKSCALPPSLLFHSFLRDFIPTFLSEAEGQWSIFCNCFKAEQGHWLWLSGCLIWNRAFLAPGFKTPTAETGCLPWRGSSGSTFGVNRRWDMTATRSLACHHSFLIMLFLLFLLNLVSTVKNTEVCVSKKT